MVPWEEEDATLSFDRAELAAVRFRGGVSCTSNELRFLMLLFSRCEIKPSGLYFLSICLLTKRRRSKDWLSAASPTGGLLVGTKDTRSVLTLNMRLILRSMGREVIISICRNPRNKSLSLSKNEISASVSQSFLSFLLSSRF